METHLPPQPPPDAPAPPPGPEAIRSRRDMGCILWVGGISVIFALIMASAPVILRSKKAPSRTETINNIKQLHLALIDFEADYGRFPDNTTISDVLSKTHTSLALGTSYSNDYFRQLIANGVTTEKIFWAPVPTTPRKPNNILGPDALKKGECSFAYVAGLTTSDDPGTPVAMTPMFPGTYQFDPDAFGDKAVILRIDGSAKVETIRADNREVSLQGGRTLFQPTAPYWHGKKPDLKWPE